MRLTSTAIMQPIAIGLCYLLATPCGAQSMPTDLGIVIVQGEGAVNRIRRRAEQYPIVRVEDDRKQPLAGATVVFTLPTEGATGEFAGQKTMVITTDERGEAAAKQLTMNAVPGKTVIHVSASFRGLSARAVINQVTIVPPGEKAGKAETGGHGKLIAVLVALGAGAGAGAAVAISQGNKQAPSTPSGGSTGPVPIGITPGTGTIAGGR